MDNSRHDTGHSSSADRFLEALFQLMNEKSYDRISVSELCKKAGFSRKTFYDNFANKDEILDYLITDFCVNYEKVDIPRDYLKYFTFWEQNQHWISLLIANDLWEPLLHKMFIKQWAAFTPKDWNQILGKQAVNRYKIYEFISAGLSRSIYLWYQNGFRETPEDMAEMIEFTLSGRMLRENQP